MVVLFGSYATGKFVDKDVYEEDGITYEYQSDYDLLVLLSKNKQADNATFTYGVTGRLNELGCSTPISPIYEGVDFVNKEISDCNYFFNDIKEQGIMLYTSKRKQLARRRKLSLVEIKQQAQDNYDEWFKSANNFQFLYEQAINNNILKEAAFMLHQATERYYHCLTLVFTNYKHKTHSIEELDKIAATHRLAFKKIFPRKSDKEKAYFSVLQKAYIDSRYKKDYSVSKK